MIQRRRDFSRDELIEEKSNKLIYQVAVSVGHNSANKKKCTIIFIEDVVDGEQSRSLIIIIEPMF